MWRKCTLALFATLLLVLISAGTALAHQAIQFGPYTLEYGWLSEPPVVGQSNSIVINVSQAAPASTSEPAEQTTAPGATKLIDISSLKVEVVYGGDSKFLTLQPLGEDTPNQYIAPILPMRAGTYTLRLSGSLGAAPVQAEVQPEEVQTADIIQFPRTNPGQSTAAGGETLPGSTPGVEEAPISADWLGIGGILLGAFGTIFGLLAFFRRQAR